MIRTAQRLGIATVAVYSEADAELPFVDLADEAVLLGAAAPADSYLNADKLLQIAASTGADALHPATGLSESPDFAARVAEAGLTWVGPVRRRCSR